MKKKDTEDFICPLLSFTLGTGIGLSVGCGLGLYFAPSRREMRKLARHTHKVVADSMENLRDSLQQYL